MLNPYTSDLVFGLTSCSRLCCNEILLSTSCLCFLLHLLFVINISFGSKYYLRFIPLILIKHWDPYAGANNNEYTMMLLQHRYEPRLVKRGSTLIFIDQQRSNVILQIPRGNIETIVPCALVLQFVLQKLRLQQYKPEISTIVKQKIDLNLICDVQPAIFSANAAVFLECLGTEKKGMEYLILFLSSLFDGDITQYKYHLPYPRGCWGMITPPTT